MTILDAAAEALIAAALMVPTLGRRCRVVMLTGACGFAGTVLAGYLLNGDDVVSPVVGRWLADPSLPSAMTSAGSALSILLIAAASWPGERWPSSKMRDGAGGSAFLAVVGYAYGPAELGIIMPFRSMSVNSATSLLLLAISSILSRPESGWAKVIASHELSGRVTRRQIMFAFVPVGLGFVLLQANRAGLLPVGAAMTLLVVFTVAPLLLLVLRDGHRLVLMDQAQADRLSLVGRYGAELQRRLDAQAAALKESNAKLLALAEAASARSEVRYRHLFDSIDAGFCVLEMRFDADGRALDYRFVEANAAFERQSGLIDAVGKWMRDLAPDHEQYWFDCYGAVARTGTSVRFERPANALDKRWFDVHAFRIDGLPTEYIGVLFNDISARRAIELQIKAVNETLEQRVAAAIAEREDAQDALRQSQKMEAIGQLTGGVAHDFNNLLTPILGSLDLLTRRGGFGERDQRLISGALQSAERAKVLVQRLLAFARRQPLQPGPVDLGALVAGMAELVASTSGPQIRVSVGVAPELPPAIGDANQLEMAILNLCVNSRDAMPHGGQLSLSVAPSQRPPEHPELPATGYVCLSVADTGLGMDAETVGRAIEPFFSTKGIGKGTGLGLSMAHGLAMQLGGALTIQSKVGLGTRIDLYLRAGDAAAEPAPDVPSSVPSSATGRVLVVDDQEQVRMTTSGLLQELGFTTEDCESGSIAEMRLARGEQFDLVVTDHLMPGLSGAELAARLAKTRPEIGVLVVSGYADCATIAPGLHFLRKPFRKDELAAAVDNVLHMVVKPVGVSADRL